MKKDKKTATLVVTLAIAATMTLGMCLIGCSEKPEYTVSFTGGVLWLAERRLRRSKRRKAK